MIFTPACGWGVSISSGCCSVSHLVLTIHSYCHGNSVCVGGGGGGVGWWAHASPPHFFGGKFNNYLRRRHFVGKDTYRPCYRNGPATLYTSVGHQLTVVPSHFHFCSHWPDKSLKKLTNIVFFVFVSQAIFSYWVSSNLFTIGQVALLKHPAARKAMGIPEMITHPSSQDPGGFWENMKAGMLPALLPGL